MVITRGLAPVKVFSLVSYLLMIANNPVIRSFFNRKMREFFLYSINFFKYFFIIIGFICFGSTIVAIMLIKSYRSELNNNWIEAIKFISIFFLSIIFQPLILSLCLGIIIIAFSIMVMFFPFLLLMYSKYNRQLWLQNLILYNIQR